ncbi:MAG: hypothetical protein QM630_08320 [Microbacterium sp.]
MNEPQVWTALGILAAALTGMIAVTTQLMMRTISAQFGTVNEKIDGLRTEMMIRFDNVDRRFEEVDRRFEQVDRRFEQVDRRLDRVERRLDGLDADVQAITKRMLPD